VRTPDEFKKMGIDVFLNHECTKINPDKKTVIFNNEKEVNYDELILTIGSSPFIPNIKNYNLKNVFNLKDIQDNIHIKTWAETSQAGVVVCGGYVASVRFGAFRRHNLKTTVREN